VRKFLKWVEVIARNYQFLFPFTLWVRVCFHRQGVCGNRNIPTIQSRLNGCYGNSGNN